MSRRKRTFPISRTAAGEAISAYHRPAPPLGMRPLACHRSRVKVHTAQWAVEKWVTMAEGTQTPLRTAGGGGTQRETCDESSMVLTLRLIHLRPTRADSRARSLASTRSRFHHKAAPTCCRHNSCTPLAIPLVSEAAAATNFQHSCPRRAACLRRRVARTTYRASGILDRNETQSEVPWSNAMK